MKYMLSFILASILSISSFAPIHAINSDYTFTIHIGAFVKANASDFDEIKPYGFIYSQRSNNLLQIYMGDYPTEGQAMKILEKVKRHNYPDAFITRRDLSKGKEERVIQLTTKQIGETIDWQYYATAGNLFVLLENNTIKILTGPFASAAESDNYLNAIKTLGFKDAFTKKVNDILLHPITTFEAGKILNNNNINTSLAVAPDQKKEVEVEPSVSLFVIPPKAATKNVEENPSPREKEVLTAREAVIPETYDVVEKRLESKPVLSPKSSPVKKVEEESTIKAAETTIVKPIALKIPVPKTRVQVKRNSTYNLQLIMKQEGVYKNSLDGFYGTDTKKSWEAIQQSNAQLKKYLLLADLEEEITEKSAAHILQHYVNTLDENPEKSIPALKNSKEATAKAYQAYAIFAQKGANKEVNDLMNAAVKQAFTNKKMENKPPFDYTATYDYKTIDQLILHLRYIQSAATEQVETPVWLFLKHPKSVQAAFEPDTEFNDDGYPIGDALKLFDWPEFDLLEAILNDLNTTSDIDADKKNQYLRSRLLLAPKNLSQHTHVSITQWNKSLWARMDDWGSKDGLHGKLLTPLKLSYFQTLVRLEDYYMDKGFDSRTATALGLKVMKTFVEKPLSQY